MRVKKRKIVEIDYPPLTTKTWIPPDQRPKKTKPPRYVKPDGMDQKLAISSLKKIWHKFLYYDRTAILVGHYSQTAKKYPLKSRGLQGACNCAVACIFAYLYAMDLWDRYTIDNILDFGNELYIKSIQQDPDRCLIYVTTNKIFNSIYLDRDKISFEIDCKHLIEEKLISIAEDQVKETFRRSLENFFKQYPSGICTMLGKNVAIWIQDDAFYLFDPTEHGEDGFPAYGIQCHHLQTMPTFPRFPSKGEGFAVVYRCLTMDDLIYRLYINLNVHVSGAKFTVEGCTVQRMVHLNVDPPERLDELEVIKEQMMPQEHLQEQKKIEKGYNVTEAKLTTYLKDIEDDAEPEKLQLIELAPDVDNMSQSKRPSWLEEDFCKSDVCRFPLPVKERPEMVTFYLDMEPKGSSGIMRAGTHQCNPNFSRYKGNQSMGNAVSALIMLKFHKSRVWVPALLNKILKYGDLMYRDAMITIPRTQELRLSNFQRKTEYLNRTFMPKVTDYVIVGRLISNNFEVLDLFSALDSFLIDHSCCVIIGPIILSVWVEDGLFYIFDPNGRDEQGKAYPRQVLEENPDQGKACTLWFKKLKDLVGLYMNNVPRVLRTDPFYLSRVDVMNYTEISEPWYNFKGVLHGMWILRANLSQSDRKFDLVSRNFQSPAMCLAMLTLVQTTPLKDFAAETVDQALEVGDRFYKDSITTLQGKEQFNNRMLMITDINHSFRWDDKLVDYDIEECVTNGVFDCVDKNFQQSLNEHFNQHDVGIVTCKAMSVALWKKEGLYYYFDSHNRDDKGLSTPYGTACVLRANKLDDLSEVLMANFAPTTENYYNIHYVKITLSTIDADDLVRPRIQFYKKIGENKSILRSLFSEISTKYDLNVNKQTLPMCIMAIGFNRLKPSIEWKQQDIDEIVNKGDAFYTDCISALLKEEETLHLADIRTGKVLPDGVEIEPPADAQSEEEVQDAEENRSVLEKKSITSEKPLETKSQKSEEEKPADMETIVEVAGNEEEERAEEAAAAEEGEPDEHEPIKITLDNMLKEFNIGFNRFDVTVEDVASGVVRPELKKALETFFNETQTDDYYHREMMVLTKPYSVITWRDDHVFYLFDPKPRDKEGYVIGLEDWSELRLPKPPKKKKGTMMMRRRRPQDLREPPEGDDLKNVTNYDVFVEGEGGLYMDMDGEGEEGAESEESEIPYPPMVHKSPSFWREKEKAGRACVIAFNRISELIDHIYTNIPPKETPELKFDLKSILLSNSTVLKQRFNEECARNDVYQGNWYSFEEVDHGMWILRGTTTICGELFPAINRGSQQVPTAYVALATAFTFSIVCYNERSVDTILRYGDKLTTFIKNYRKSQLKQIVCECADRNNKLCDDEINWIVQREQLNINDIPKKMCISKFIINVNIQAEVVTGDVNAQDFEDIFDVKRGINDFFKTYQYGILEAKGLTVAIWKGARMYYMFDGLNRGRNGITAPYGVACITRYLDIGRMTDTFLANLPKFGNNCFSIHNVTMLKDICPREHEPAIVIPPMKTVALGGYNEVAPGKSIVRGTITQNDPKFENMTDSMGAPIAIVALTMTLLHRTYTWSKPIIDEIIELGAELYDESVQTLGFNFNPWQETLDLSRVNRMYNVGVVKASCEVRTPDVRGIIDIKDPCTINLRQGIHKFFEENTHGVLVCEPITVAIWEEKLEDGTLMMYMFDPNSRGPSGMTTIGGTACLVSFINTKLMTDHLLSLIEDPVQLTGLFEIIPVEIVVGTLKIPCKAKKDKTSVSIVSPKCAQVTEEKKLLRRYAEYQRRKREARRLQLLGRKDLYITKTGDVLIRGYKSQNSPCFPDVCRNKQDIPNCIISIVMHHLISIDRWNCKNIDLILVAGNQLYIDSYIAYGPKDLKLGMENVVRKFFLKHLIIHVTVYKPIISDVFNEDTLFRILAVFFTQEHFCILNHWDQWVALFFKSGQFYMFDPHERDLEGFPPKRECCGCGSAVVMRFDDIFNLTKRLITNLTVEKKEVEERPKSIQEEVAGEEEGEEEEQGDNLFTLWLVSVEVR